MARAPTRRGRRKRRRDEWLPAIVTAAVIVTGAWIVSWWIVPVAALVAGAVWWKRADVAQQALWGAVAAWLVLLLVDSLHLRTWALARALGGAVFMPWGLLFVTTLLFAAGLAWSSATVGAYARQSATAKRARKRKEPESE